MVFERTMNRLKTTMVPSQIGDNPSEYEETPSCLSGLFVLTGEGALARLSNEATAITDPELSGSLSAGANEILDSYRNGAVDGLCLGLIMDPGQGDPGTLVFRDDVMNTLFDAGRRTGTPPTHYESGNKYKTVSQGMKVLLDKKKTSEPYFPYFCPALLVPEVDGDTLAARYGVDPVAAGTVYEVIDLSVPFLSTHRPPEELFRMRRDMRRLYVGNMFESGPDAGVEGRTVSPDLGLVEIAATGDEVVYRNGDPVTGWLLEWFSPFNELTETQREIIAGYETIRKADAGTRLINCGAMDDICVYLVEGTLELETEEGETIRVTGGTRRSRLPISVLTPHVYEVTAVTDVSFVVFSQTLVRKINEITRTYTGVHRASSSEASTAAISNGMQSVYLKYVDVSRSPEEC